MDEPEPSPTPPRRSPRRRLRRGGAALGLLVAAWMAISFAVAYRLTGRRHALYPEPPPRVAWGDLEGLRLVSGDGLEIGGWFAEGRPDAPSILFLHGNGGDRHHCLERARILASELGCATMFISLRAHGDSEGDFNDIGYSARHDVIAAVDFLRERRPGRPIVVFGVSLGSAAAAFAAADLIGKVDGYVLESPYQDLKTAVWNRTHAYLPPGLDLVAYLGLRIAALVLLPELDAIAPVLAVGSIPEDVPVLLLAGDADDLATPEEAEAIRRRLASHARLVRFPGATHHNLATVEPDRYRRTIVEFVVDRRNVRDGTNAEDPPPVFEDR